jgi:RHS repeat-associated protein
MKSTEKETQGRWMKQSALVRLWAAAGLFCLALPLNQAQAAEIYYLHTDHLDTPRAVTNAQNQIIWRNTPLTEPFGSSAPEEDPDGDGQTFTLNLRFPGQYDDQETGTHYNSYRDHYFPSLGRYGQSDPIGLAGGINTYLYVRGNPISLIDFLGLLGFSEEECKRILEEIEREWGTIEKIERLIDNIKPGVALPKLEDYKLRIDATPSGFRGSTFNSSSETYQSSVNKLEADTAFAAIGRVKNFLGGIEGLMNGDFKSGQTRTMWLTEILRIYYVIREMEKIYEEECKGCEN